MTWTLNGGTEISQVSLKTILICDLKINKGLMGLEQQDGE